MSIRKTLIACLALAMAIVFSPLADLRAATLVSPGSQPGTENLVQSVKMKRKGKVSTMAHKVMGKMKKHRMGKHHRGRKAHSRSGRCGTNMYWKKGKCMDARNK